MHAGMAERGGGAFGGGGGGAPEEQRRNQVVQCGEPVLEGAAVARAALCSRDVDVAPPATVDLPSTW